MTKKKHNRDEAKNGKKETLTFQVVGKILIAFFRDIVTICDEFVTRKDGLNEDVYRKLQKPFFI
jgi:hypothetical protein